MSLRLTAHKNKKQKFQKAVLQCYSATVDNRNTVKIRLKVCNAMVLHCNAMVLQLTAKIALSCNSMELHCNSMVLHALESENVGNTSLRMSCNTCNTGF